MHCTAKKTLYEIVKQGNDYRVCVKANQQRLYRGIAQQSKTQQPLNCDQAHEQGHGRNTTWCVSVFDGVTAFGHEWPGIQSAIVVQRHGDRAGKPFDERQSYISRGVATAEQFHRIIRGHWSIENRWHWVKDVTLNEDHAPQTGRNAVANWSVVRNFFITLRAGWGSLRSLRPNDSSPISCTRFSPYYNETALPINLRLDSNSATNAGANQYSALSSEAASAKQLNFSRYLDDGRK